MSVRAKQDGFVLILIVLSMLTIGAVVLFASYGVAIKGKTDSVTVASNASAAETNNAAKQALINYVLNQTSDEIRPGTLPLPDSLAFKTVASPSDGVYDGMMDNKCLSSNTNGLPAQPLALSTDKRCLGKLPWKSLSMSFNVDAADMSGQVPWLAISANLANTYTLIDPATYSKTYIDYDNCLKVVNSNIALLSSPTPPIPTACPTIAGPPYPQPTQLPHPWLTVRDATGQILSDKVAAVLIVPGKPMTTESRTQARTLTSPGNPSDYLDDIKLPLGCTTCTTHDNAGLTNQFIQLEPGTRYPSDSADMAKRGTLVPFNDVVIYITVEELMYYAEQRVLKSMKKSLVNFKADTIKTGGTYPWMSPLNAILSSELNIKPTAGTIVGSMPFASTDAIDSMQGVTSYASEFSWKMTNLNGIVSTLTPACRRIASSPNRFIASTLKNAISLPLSEFNLAESSAGLDAGQCEWRGEGRMHCSNQPTKSIVSSFQQNTTVFSNNTCTTPIGVATVTVSRAITALQLDAKCSSAAALSYTPNTIADVNRWTWDCNNLLNPIISFDVTDTVSNFGASNFNLLPRQFVLKSNGSVAGIKVSGMRYHPTMPYWHYTNQWFLTSFAARSPSTNPAPAINPCTPTTDISVGGKSKNDAIVLLSGRKNSSQTQPSNSITNYLEGLNTMSATTCQFEKELDQGNRSGADQIMVVAP